MISWNTTTLLELFTLLLRQKSINCPIQMLFTLSALRCIITQFHCEPSKLFTIFVNIEMLASPSKIIRLILSDKQGNSITCIFIKRFFLCFNNKYLSFFVCAILCFLFYMSARGATKSKSSRKMIVTEKKCFHELGCGCVLAKRLRVKSV